MRVSLLWKRKFEFVTGAYSKEMYEEELYEQWKTCNEIVVSWLMSLIKCRAAEWNYLCNKCS